MAYPRSTSTLIEVFDINSMQTTARDILGLSNTGYGFTSVVSRPVNNRTIIGASTFNRLLTDTNVISVHQLNVSTSTPAAVVGEVIPASFVNNLHGHLEYLLNDNNRYIAHPEQLSALNTTGGVSTRTNQWSRMSHIVQASWPTTSTAQWFFNSGGKIELNSSHANNDTGTITTAWKTLIDGLGTYTYARPEFMIGDVTTSVTALVSGYPIEWRMTAIKADDAKSIRFTTEYIIAGIYNPYFIVSPDAAIWYISLTASPPGPPGPGGDGGGGDAPGPSDVDGGFVDAVSPGQTGDNGGDGTGFA